MAVGASHYLAKEMALFIAKKKAVDLAGRYLLRKSLIGFNEQKRDEIYSLTAREVKTEVLEEGQKADGNLTTYHLRIKARIHPSDFVKAEMEDFKEERKRGKRILSRRNGSTPCFRNRSGERYR